MHKLAAILHHGMGDVIMALPALWAVDRAVGQRLVLDLVVKRALEASIINSVPWQGTVRTLFIPAGAKLKRAVHGAKVFWQLRRARPQVLVTPHMFNAGTARKVSRLVGAPVSVLPAQDSQNASVHTLVPDLGEHKSRYYARYFHAAGVPIDLDDLPFPPLTLQPADPVRRRVLLAPAVGAPLEQHKGWPEQRFADLAVELLRQIPRIAVELVGAPPERPVLERVLAQVPADLHGQISLVTKSGVREAAEAMTGAAAIVTACSGASHLAAWAGIPVIGLYGPTNPAFTGPFTRQLYVVRKGYACGPCYRQGFISGCGTPVCMTNISVEDVLQAVSAALAGDTWPIPARLVTTKATTPDYRMAI